ncbi:hypothetical protein [Caproicibacterium sp. XB2]
MKFESQLGKEMLNESLPTRERGLKSNILGNEIRMKKGRSLHGSVD